MIQSYITEWSENINDNVDNLLIYYSMYEMPYVSLFWIQWHYSSNWFWHDYLALQCCKGSHKPHTVRVWAVVWSQDEQSLMLLDPIDLRCLIRWLVTRTGVSLCTWLYILYLVRAQQWWWTPSPWLRQVSFVWSSNKSNLTHFALLLRKWMCSNSSAGPKMVILLQL